MLEIEDYVTASPQTQTFSYDALDRLTAAQATGGGLGLYAEAYTYDPLTGNLASKGGTTYAYGDPLHAHAATALSSGWTYAYDSNGNMTLRLQGGTQYQLTYDAENHLTQVSGAYQAQFDYNGDGQRVIAVHGGETRLFIGNYFEWNATISTSRKYYFAGGARVALRDESGALHWLLGEALGSTSVSATASTTTGQGYRAWGEARFGSLPTEYQYTGQYRQPGLGLDYFNARWYDPALGRWTQPDTIVPDPGNPQSYDRYAYVYNNPLGYIDPTGHFTEDEMCRYWGYCSKEACEEGLGQGFCAMLWGTEITWGDTLLIGDENGVNLAAIFILKYVDGQYTAALWDLSNGVEISWEVAKSASQLAAYNEANNVWETAAIESIWGNRIAAEKWAGYTPSSHYAHDLFLNWQYEGYYLTDYQYYDPFWYALMAASVIASFLNPRYGMPFGLAVTGIGIVDDAGIGNLPIGGPKPITYPLLVFIPDCRLNISGCPSGPMFWAPGIVKELP